MTPPKNLHYTADHEWLKLDGTTATVGITDYAQSSLGDLVFVELPKLGQKLTKGSGFAVVESVKAASEVYAPASGEVIAINEALVAAPQAINEDPYGQGWIAKIALSQPDELKEAMDEVAYAVHLKDAA